MSSARVTFWSDSLPTALWPVQPKQSQIQSYGMSKSAFYLGVSSDIFGVKGLNKSKNGGIKIISKVCVLFHFLIHFDIFEAEWPWNFFFFLKEQPPPELLQVLESGALSAATKKKGLFFFFFLKHLLLLSPTGFTLNDAREEREEKAGETFTEKGLNLLWQSAR